MTTHGVQSPESGVRSLSLSLNSELNFELELEPELNLLRMSFFHRLCGLSGAGFEQLMRFDQIHDCNDPAAFELVHNGSRTTREHSTKVATTSKRCHGDVGDAHLNLLLRLSPGLRIGSAVFCLIEPGACSQTIRWLYGSTAMVKFQNEMT